MDVNEILKNIDDFFDNMPKEIIDEIDAKVAAVSFLDVSFEKYLSSMSNFYDFFDVAANEFIGTESSVAVTTENTSTASMSEFLSSVSEENYADEQRYVESKFEKKPVMWYRAA